MKNVNYNNTSKYDTVEFKASKLSFHDAVLFLQRQCEGLLSTREARSWAHQIARIFPQSLLAKTFEQPITIMSRKRTRLLARKESKRQANQQLELLFSFTFKK